MKLILYSHIIIIIIIISLFSCINSHNPKEDFIGKLTIRSESDFLEKENKRITKILADFDLKKWEAIYTEGNLHFIEDGDINQLKNFYHSKLFPLLDKGNHNCKVTVYHKNKIVEDFLFNNYINFDFSSIKKEKIAMDFTNRLTLSGIDEELYYTRRVEIIDLGNIQGVLKVKVEKFKKNDLVIKREILLFQFPEI